MPEYLSVDELRAIGFKHVGRSPRVSSKCSFYGISGAIGDNVRIDDFCVLKGDIHMGSFVHIASFGLVSAAHAPIHIGDFVSFAARVSVLTGSDDYAAKDSLNNSEYATVLKAPISIGLGTIVGVGSVILPGVKIGVGASIGAGCIIKNDVLDGEMYRNGFVRSIGVRDHGRIKILACRVLENMDGEV
jgi:dTDP-4-amino-4,6-dideoxy-D-glucose acyltransferase